MHKSSCTTTRTIHDRTAPLRDRRQIAAEVARCLKTDFHDRKSRNKEIARKAESSPRTVEAWTDGTNLPGLEYFLRLVPDSPSLQKMLMRLMSFDADTDPEYHRAFIEFMNAVQRARQP